MVLANDLNACLGEPAIFLDHIHPITGMLTVGIPFVRGEIGPLEQDFSGNIELSDIVKEGTSRHGFQIRF